MQVTVFAPATIGNVGPGFDCLGLAVDGLGDKVSVSLSRDGEDTLSSVTGIDAETVPLDTKKNSIFIAGKHFLKSKSLDYKMQVSIERGIPISGGLGSSAAAALGGALAAAYASDCEFSQEDILEAALAGEGFTSGRHCDNIAPCLLGGLTFVLSNDPPLIYPLLKSCDDWHLALVTPQVKMPTKEARQVLPESSPRSEWIKVMANEIGMSHAFAQQNKSLLKKLCDPFAEPRRSQFIPDYEQIKSSALESGALYCGISGAGPTLFAICESKELASQAVDAMSKKLKDKPRLTHVGRVAMKGAHRL
ncbi:MAG: homoserine kinase [Oligoflexales bacterium]|nr:homoserine kinase [Oligoflexales bacterium]